MYWLDTLKSIPKLLVIENYVFCLFSGLVFLVVFFFHFYNEQPAWVVPWVVFYGKPSFGVVIFSASTSNLPLPLPDTRCYS